MLDVRAPAAAQTFTSIPPIRFLPSRSPSRGLGSVLSHEMVSAVVAPGPARARRASGPAFPHSPGAPYRVPPPAAGARPSSPLYRPSDIRESGRRAWRRIAAGRPRNCAAYASHVLRAPQLPPPAHPGTLRPSRRGRSPSPACRRPRRGTATPRRAPCAAAQTPSWRSSSWRPGGRSEGSCGQVTSPARRCA